MNVKGIAGSLTLAIADSEIQSLVNEATTEFRRQAGELIGRFAGEPPTAQKANNLKNDLHEQLRELGKRLIQAIFSRLQPQPEDMPGTVSHRRKIPPPTSGHVASRGQSSRRSARPR